MDVGDQVSGRPEALHFDVGSIVVTGQLLAVIDAMVQAASVKALDASLAELQADHALLEVRLNFVTRQVDWHGALTGLASTVVSVEEARCERMVLRVSIDLVDANIRRSVVEFPAEGAVLDHARISGPMSG